MESDNNENQSNVRLQYLTWQFVLKSAKMTSCNLTLTVINVFKLTNTFSNETYILLAINPYASHENNYVIINYYKDTTVYVACYNIIVK